MRHGTRSTATEVSTNRLDTGRSEPTCFAGAAAELARRLRRAGVRHHHHPGAERHVRHQPGALLRAPAALLTVVGNAAGFYAQVVLVAFGLGALLERSIVAYNTVKFVGALYLVWLGIQTFRRRRELAQVDDATELQPHRSILLDGFVVGVANPKTIVFFAAVLPQYVRADGAPAAIQMAVLGLIFVAVALASDSVWGIAAGTARGWFARSPRRLERLGGAGGIAIAAWACGSPSVAGIDALQRRTRCRGSRSTRRGDRRPGAGLAHEHGEVLADLRGDLLGGVEELRAWRPSHGGVEIRRVMGHDQHGSAGSDCVETA